MYVEKELKEKSKEELITKYLDLQDEFNDLADCYGELEEDNGNLQEQLDELEYSKPDDTTMILDIDLFKDKLELYDLKSEELWNFIDDYMKLYNKE
jgi:chromosome segregation ATPase